MCTIVKTISAYLSDEPFPQRVEQEVSKHFSNVYKSRARARGELVSYHREVTNSAAVYRMVDEVIVNHVSVYFTLRDLNAARMACIRWYCILTKNIIWQCQIPRYIPLVVMPLPAYLQNETLEGYNQVKLIFINKRMACLQEAGFTITGVHTYRDLDVVETIKDQLVEKLYIFAREDQIDLVRIILQSPSVNQESRGAAVKRAAEFGHLAVLQELLKDGAVISQKDRGLAVCRAAENGHFPIVQELLKSGTVISECESGEALILAAKNGHLGIVQELLKDGTQVDRVEALIYAAMNGHLLIVQELINGGEITPEHRQEAIQATTNQDIINLLSH